MPTLRHVLIGLCALFAALGSCEATQADTSKVVILESRTFDSSVKNGELWFVEFYAPWCGHCKRLESTWEELAVTLEGTARLAKVDGTSSQALAARFSVRGFPSLFLIKGSQVYQYAGNRNKAALQDFVEGGYKTSEAMSYMQSPFGPLGTVKGAIIGLGTSMVEIFNKLTDELGLPKWAAFMGLSLAGMAAVFALTIVVMWLFSPSEKPKRD